MLTTVRIKRTIIIERNEILVISGEVPTEHSHYSCRAMVILAECKLFNAVILTVIVLNYLHTSESSKPTTKSEIATEYSNLNPQQVKKQSSSDPENLELIRLEVLTQNILKRLGFDSPPSVSRLNATIEEQREKIREYRNHLVSQGDTEYIPDSNDVKNAEEKYFTYTGVTRRPGKGKRQIIRFEVDVRHPEDDPFSELLVQSATLTLHKKSGPKHLKNKNITINVFKVSTHEDGFRISRNISRLQSINVLIGDGSTLDIDVTEVVREWVNKNISRQEIGLSCDNHSIKGLFLLRPKKMRRFTGQRNVSIQEKYPKIRLSSRVVPIVRRQKRFVDEVERKDCTVGDGYKNCCRFKTRVNFTEIGWNFVIAPRVYDAYYCEGACPTGHKMASTFTGIKASLHKLYPDKFSGACCVPSAYKPLTILHADDQGSYTFTDFSDMIVQDCACS